MFSLESLLNVAIIVVLITFVAMTVTTIGVDKVIEYVSSLFQTREEERGEVRRRRGTSARRLAVAGDQYDPSQDAGHVVKYSKSNDQREVLREHLENIVFTQNLDSDHLNELLDAFFLKKVKQGEYIIKKGDEGDYFYIIEKGIYKALDGASVIQTYENEGSFGELALLYSVPRAASVRAETDGQIWALDRFTFKRIIASAAHKDRKIYDECIKSVNILNHLSEVERLNLSDALVTREFSNGDVIFQEGREADGMYFVISGEVVIHKEENGEKHILKIVEKGGYFGELALMTKEKRAANAVAKGDVKTAFLDTEAFIRLLGPCEEALKTNISKYNLRSDHNIH